MLVALGKRVIIKPCVKEEEQTASGLYLPVTGNKESDIGEVVGIGNGDKLKKNDFVVMPHYGMNKVYIDNVLYYIAFESDILGRIVKAGYKPTKGVTIETPVQKSFISLTDDEGIEVLGNRVLIKCEADKDTYGDSGIVKPDQFKRYAKSGWIVAIGDDVKLDELGIDVKDRMFYDCYSGVDIDINGISHKFIHIDNLMSKDVLE
jgi:co-chaperonin GroES (HSP10)